MYWDYSRSSSMPLSQLMQHLESLQDGNHSAEAAQCAKSWAAAMCQGKTLLGVLFVIPMQGGIVHDPL